MALLMSFSGASASFSLKNFWMAFFRSAFLQYSLSMKCYSTRFLMTVLSSLSRLRRNTLSPTEKVISDRTLSRKTSSSGTHSEKIFKTERYFTMIVKLETVSLMRNFVTSSSNRDLRRRVF